MSAELPRYPTLKPTGVPWLGDVPAHWEVPRLGNLLKERGETNSGNRVTDVLSLLRDRGVIPYADKGNIGNKKSEDITRYKIVRPNDIVVNCMNVIIGSVGLSRYTGCLSPVYYVLVPRAEDDLPEYLNAYFQTKSFQRSLVRIGNGILAHRMRIPMELLKCEPFPRPPTEEQRAIVRYLDHHDRLIRRYLRAKRRLIALLEEQKQAVIQQAVTRGLDPSVPMKDSGVAWLGEIPAHWEVRRLKTCAYVQTGITLGKRYDGPLIERPYLRVANVQAGRLDLTQVKTISVPTSEARGSQLLTGDVLMTEGGDIDKLGRGCLWHGEIPGCLHQNHVFAVRTEHDVLLPKYLAMAMSSGYGRDYFWSTAKQTTNLASTNSTTLGCFPLALPGMAEQEAIIAYVSRETSSLDKAISATQHEIDLIREYHTRLIADVVTGKVDVRDAAAALLDIEPEAENDEPLDEDDDDRHDDDVDSAGVDDGDDEDVDKEEL